MTTKKEKGSEQHKKGEPVKGAGHRPPDKDRDDDERESDRGKGGNCEPGRGGKPDPGIVKISGGLGRLKGTQTWTAWLLLRYTDTDLGLRPTPPGAPFWVSPDIWVESSDPLGNPVAGEHNFVHARVFNLGMADAAPTRVDFYWADPSLGLGAANMNLIGTQWVQVPRHTSVDVRCAIPWVPVYLNGGHECLMVNTNNAIFDRITHPFQPWLDRHVGQRNMHVLQAAPGHLVNLSLVVNNLFPIHAQALITAHVEHLVVEERARKELKPLEIVNHLAAYGAGRHETATALKGRYAPGIPEFAQAAKEATWLQAHKRPAHQVVRLAAAAGSFKSSAAHVTGRWDEHVSVIRQPQGRTLLANAFAAADKLTGEAATHQRVHVGEAMMKPSEQRRLWVGFGVPSGAKPGEFLVYHLAQQIEGIVVGGYTTIIEVVKETRS